MSLLLDTHVLIWALDSPKRLAPEVRGEIEDPHNEIFFSAASIWEIAIKSGLGKLDFPHSAEAIAQGAIHTGFTELPVTAKHAAAVARLPTHHRDPFDRLLIAQALALPAHLLTVDAALGPYSDLVRCL
jgi:PIN domain nuclease of toxin-antitoxin system